jgi:hypothetical protein
MNVEGVNHLKSSESAERMAHSKAISESQSKIAALSPNAGSLAMTKRKHLMHLY